MKISIVTICKNEVDRIENTILSILNQTYKNKEIIIVDGGSTDGTIEILNQYRNIITHLTSEHDSGIYNAMNKGISLCSGEYIQFMNGGDAYSNNTVLADLVSDGISTDIVFGDALYEYKNGITKYFKHPNKLTSLYLALSTVNHQSMLMNKSLFIKYGDFNERYLICADYNFLLKVVIRGNATANYVPILVSICDREGISFKSEYTTLKRKEIHDIQKLYLPAYLIYLSNLRLYLVKYKHYIFPSFMHAFLNSIYNKFLFGR